MKKIIIAFQDAIKETPAFMLRQLRYDHVFTCDILLAVVPNWLVLTILRLLGMVQVQYRHFADQFLLYVPLAIAVWVGYRIIESAVCRYLNFLSVEHEVNKAIRQGDPLPEYKALEYLRIV